MGPPAEIAWRAPFYAYSEAEADFFRESLLIY